MQPDQVTQLVKNHVQAEFKKLNSSNSVEVECLHAGKWWLSDPNNANFQAAARAMKTVFGTHLSIYRGQYYNLGPICSTNNTEQGSSRI